MSASAALVPHGNPLGRAVRRIAGGVRSFWSGISAVSTKELRGRMRGRRAFVVVTIYLLLLSIFAFGIYLYLKQQALQTQVAFTGGAEQDFFKGGPGPGIGTQVQALSASVGHSIFSGLLLVETLLILVLAPAFTSGAVSLEREKGTIDLLVTTPLSTLGMVLGKLFSALIWVFLLILASIPLASLVFAFGGVGPEDLVRGYALLFALAFGMGAIGLFISALVRRTQTATVITFVAVLVVTLGSMATYEFWRVITTQSPAQSDGFVAVQTPSRPPEALLWLNPFVGDADLICTTAPGGYERHTCDYVAMVTGTPYFGPNTTDPSCPPNAGCVVPFVKGDAGSGVVVQACVINQPCVAMPSAICAPNGLCAGAAGGVGVAEPEQNAVVQTFGFPRDTFWPRSALAFVVVGVVLTLISAQLVAPTRRFRLFRRWGRRPARLPALATLGGAIPDTDATLRGEAASEASPLEPDPADPRDPRVDEVRA